MAEVADTEIKRSEVKPGIRGWLLVLVLWLGVVSPIFWIGFNFIVFDRMESVNPADAEFMRDMGWDILLWAVTIIREGVRVAAALVLYFYRKPVAVWIAFAVLWLSGPLLILGTWGTIEASEYNLPALVRSTLWALAWSLFLFMSQRVRLTYGFRPRQ